MCAQVDPAFKDSLLALNPLINTKRSALAVLVSGLTSINLSATGNLSLGHSVRSVLTNCDWQ